MELIEITEVNDVLAQMVAQFRVELRTYKGIVSKPNKVILLLIIKNQLYHFRDNGIITLEE